MKCKLISLLTMLFCLFVLASCGNGGGEPPVANSPAPTDSQPQGNVSPTQESSPAPESSAPKQAEYRKVSAEEAELMMKESSNFILLDVRTEEEFKEQRIDGAILIPDTEISNRAEKELPDKDAVILIYCRSGRRSALAANELVSLGYLNVYDFGGIIDWPYETISG